MNKKIVLSTLLTILSVTTLVGCGNTSGANTDSRVIKAWINTGNEFDGANKDSIWQKIEEETGVTLKLTGGTHGTSYYQALNPTLASKRCDLDIVFSVPSNANSAYENLIDQDIYWNIEELLTLKPGQYPNIEKILRSDVYKNIFFGDNNHSLIPYLTSRSGWTIYYRSDWLINVGYYTEDGSGNKIAKVPTTISEFADVMKKFTENDPDKDGKNNTYAFSPAGNYFYLNPLYHAFGVTPDYDFDNNNKASYMYTTQEFRNFLKWINEMFNRGYIDPEFAANAANTTDRDKFYQGNVGILITNGENHVEWVVPGVEKGQGKKNIVTVGPAPVGDSKLGKEGVGGFSDWGGWWGGYSIYKHRDGKKLNYDKAYACLDLLDYLYSEEGGLLRTYGIKDQHWKYEDGQIVPIISGRVDERDKTFTAVEDENGYKQLTGTYRMGTAWGNRVIWKSDTEFVAEVTDANIPYSNRALFNATVERNNVISSKLVNFTGFATGFTIKMNQFEREMDKYAVTVTTQARDLNNLNSFDDGWDAELTKLNNQYSWGSIQQMIEERARAAGII